MKPKTFFYPSRRSGRRFNPLGASFSHYLSLTGEATSAAAEIKLGHYPPVCHQYW
jgi:hypothetical protein